MPLRIFRVIGLVGVCLAVSSCGYDFAVSETDDLPDGGDNPLLGSDAEGDSHDSQEMPTESGATGGIGPDDTHRTDSETHTEVDTATLLDTDVDTTETGSDEETGTPNETDTGTGVETDTGAETDTDSGPAELWLTFWERIYSITYYRSHRVLVGPASSTDPEDGSWEVAADEFDMLNYTASALWAPGFAVDLRDFSGQEIRVAFHYSGHMGDDWVIDDICVAGDDRPTVPSDCLWSESFDTSDGTVWPNGWMAVAGEDNWEESNDWKVDPFFKKSSPYAASISYSYMSFPERYLVSGPIVLP